MNIASAPLRPIRPLATSPWLVRHGHATAPSRLRLYCFSYAGGSAGVYLPWRAALDPTVELYAVQLPGRGMRMAEAPQRDLQSLLKLLAPVITGEACGPFTFFGHSLGALLAFELTRYLALRQLPLPVKLIVSGANAPQMRSPVEHLDEHDDDKMIERLSRYNGTPPEVLQHRELMRLLAPAIRADFALAADYVYRPSLALDIPLTVFAGRADDEISPEQVQAWQCETRGSFAQHWFEGDHFFIHSQRERVLAQLNAELSPGLLSSPKPTP